MNVMRWFGRIAATKDTCQVFCALRDSLRSSFLNAEEDLWPPHTWEIEDVSCIDPIWSCEEAEEVLWKADRDLDAFLTVTSMLQQRFHIEIDANDPMIRAGLKWHLPEIRLAAFRIWLDCSEKSCPQSERDAYLGLYFWLLCCATLMALFSEEFILNNGMSSSTGLRKAVEVAANSCNMSEHGRSEWMKMLSILRKQAKLDEEQVNIVDIRGSSYLSDELSEADLITLPAPWEAKERLEEFLRISGSSDAKSCPSFPELYDNLSKAGYDQRVFARFLIDLINLIKSHEYPKTAIAIIAEAVTRCRLKVFVEHGCTVIDELLTRQHSEQHFFFLAEYGYCWAMNHLTDKDVQCRTLALSRMLWSVCEKSKDLMKIFFETCRTTLADSLLDGKVHERVLKTLKLFSSKADCKMPADFVEFLFWHCIDAQEDENFLVRSAATILYGFIVRYITKSRAVPAFFIVSTRAKFWRDTMSRCSSLSELPQLQRILLLSFLTRLKLGHADCYAETVLGLV
ncbi:hypothetical protein OESDEN_20538 [Oesophagostomum dentatum]|uniref:Uncharacterized protein n=1 Tax=Oesophagostomum dentatum TaxID=61180 RepID=A0A0B1S9A9_OESDE|nr:hypothetical protein OESDEN_20538 [Oesophagostomum dentatum]